LKRKANTVKCGAFGNPKIRHEERRRMRNKKIEILLVESSVYKHYRKVLNREVVET
jgi:hypothetical protein